MKSGSQFGSEAAVKRPRRGEAFWRKAIECQRDSGMTQQMFCDREGLALSTFTRWSQRLSERAVMQAEHDEVQFVRLRPSAAAESMGVGSGSALHVRLELGAGLSIEIVRH